MEYVDRLRDVLNRMPSHHRLVFVLTHGMLFEQAVEMELYEIAEAQKVLVDLIAEAIEPIRVSEDGR